MNAVVENSSRETIVSLISNGAGFGVAAITGLLLSVFVAFGWQAEGLGVVSQALAFHIVATQIAVLGQQNALVNFVSLNAKNVKQIRVHVQASHLIAILFASIASLALFASSSALSTVMESPALYPALKYTAIAVFFGSLVKLQLSILTGREFMKSLAFVQAVRPTLVLINAIIVLHLGLSVEHVLLGIAISELISLLIGAILAMRGLAIWKISQFDRKLFSDHLQFGIKSMLAGVIGELNTRVDILVLGIFASDKIVGIYAFAAMLAEGFFLLGIVCRIVFSPKIVKMLAENRKETFIKFFRFWRIRVYAMAIVVFVLSVALFPLVLKLLNMEMEMMRGWLIYSILAFGVLMAAGYIPFSSILMLGGYPGMHSLYFGCIVILNLAGNLILTPLYGAVGTAIATSIAYTSSVLVLILLCKRVINIRLV